MYTRIVMNHKTSGRITLFSLTIISVVFALVTIFILPPKVRALSIFSPFGGKIQFPGVVPAIGCLSIRAAVLAATAGSIDISVDQMKVGPPSKKTFGSLKINGVQVMPPPTNIYKESLGGIPRIPQTWVLGKSINICEVCNLADNVPSASAICKKIPGMDKIIDAVCGTVGSSCPITNLVYEIGSGKSIFGF